MQLLAVFKKISTVRKLAANNLLVFKFKDHQTAIAFFDFTYAILPIRNTEYPKINNNECILTDDQYSCCQFYAAQRSGELSPEMLGDQYFLKTLRADTLDYSYAFILGIMPGNAETKRQNLRFVNRGHFTVDPKGNATTRINKNPMYTPEQKKGFSQIQSCTFIDSKIISPAFGFTKERNRKLYGLMTHWNDARVNRMLVDDGGTVGHVFDATDSIEARRNRFSAYEITEEKNGSLTQKKRSKKRCYSPVELNEFKAHNLEARPDNWKTNECLVRLRFNPYRSVVSICSDTLESRLLAYDFAQELLEYYADYAKKNGLELNKNFRIPIVFYLRKTPTFMGVSAHENFTVGHFKHDLRFYTEDMHLEDQKKACAIYNDSAQRHSHFLANDYEFLLGLETITPEMLLEEDGYGIPLACAMIRTGYVRMLGRLLRKDNEKKNLLVVVLAELIKRNFFVKNDRMISQLIMAEAFNIAEILIQETNSEKYALLVGDKKLSTHLINYGNPRQLNYMGFDKILIMAAERGAWVTIVLCVKEYPNMDKGLLGQLLCYACQRSQYKEAELLLKMGAYRSSEVSGLRAIQHTVENKDWAMVGIFSQFPADEHDLSYYGFALLKALQHQQRGIAKLLLLAGAKPYWRSYIKNHEMESTLYYAVEHDYNELLPDLIKHEAQCQGSLATSRQWLAADLAVLKKNEWAIELLSEFRISDSFFMNQPDLVCRLVVEALAIGSREMAIYRLKKYLNTSDLESVDGDIIMNGFRIIKDSLQWSCSYFPLHYKKVVLKNIIEILLANKELLLLTNLVAHFRSQKDYSTHIDELFFEVISRKVSSHNLGFIKDLIKEMVRNAAQQQCWQLAINEALYDSVKSAAMHMPYLLLELGAEPDYNVGGGRAIVEKVAYLDNEILLKHLLENYSFSLSIKMQLLTAAINIRGLKWLVFELIEKYKTEIHPKHIELSARISGEDVLLPLLDAVDKNHYYDHSFRFAFFSAWIYGSKAKSNDVCKKLMAMLRPAYIKHLTLQYLLVAYRVSLSDWELTRYLFPNLNVILNSEYLSVVEKNLPKIKLSAFHETNLRMLNNYFHQIHSLPTDDVILSTYETMLSQFKQVTPKTSSGFFSDVFDSAGFESSMYSYLVRVDLNLAKFVPEPALKLSKSSSNTNSLL
ncbi:MAG: hypothetical protein K2X50_00360 [Gammaproteobacteria bacterium]|nr:hypothetical protein [Gammaproteobacteria bacterium]